MQRADAGKIRDLLPAGRTGRNEHLARCQTSRRGQETALANLTRDLEVLARIPERSGHPPLPPPPGPASDQPLRRKLAAIAPLGHDATVGRFSRAIYSPFPCWLRL